MLKRIDYMFRNNWNRFVVERDLFVTLNNFKREGTFLDNTLYRYPHTVIRMMMTCGGAPVQYEGSVNGSPAYYRDRHGEWRFEVYDANEKVIFKREGSSDSVFGLSGMLDAELRIMDSATKFVRKTNKPLIERNECLGGCKHETENTDV